MMSYLLAWAAVVSVWLSSYSSFGEAFLLSPSIKRIIIPSNHHRHGSYTDVSSACSSDKNARKKRAAVARLVLAASNTTPESDSTFADQTAKTCNNDDDEETMKQLLFIAQRLKLEVFDLDEGIFGFESQDSRFGIQVISTKLSLPRPDSDLGLVLTQVAGNMDGRGLVLVSDIITSTGGVGTAAATARPAIQVGDTIVGIAVGNDFRERCTALNYDRTVEIIRDAKQHAAMSGSGTTITLELNRLVPRAEIVVQVEDASQVETKTQEIRALAGENLRRMLLRKGIKLYDSKTKRFDMPYAVGDCAGEGLCGTCLVQIQKGAELLNEQDHMEQIITKGRPASWRASCRTIVGVDNKPGRVEIRIKPQSDYEDELNPGVRDIN